MLPSLSPHLGSDSFRNAHSLNSSSSSSNTLKRARTPARGQDDTHRSGIMRTGSDREDGPGERRRKTLLADLHARSARCLAGLFESPVPMQNAGFRPVIATDSQQADSLLPALPANRSARMIDEEDYGDDDEDGDDSGETETSIARPSSLQDKTTNGAPNRTNTNPQKLTKVCSNDTKAAEQKPEDLQSSAEVVRKKLEAEKKAAEDAAKESFQTMFYTLENDRDAMLEQQKLDELDREVETDMSEQQKAAQGSALDGIARQGTLSSANLGASSLALKHLIAKVDAKRNLVRATDTQLRVLMSEVRKNRSKWANEEKVGQEELYESAERVLMDLKARTEYSSPFLQKVNKRDAPDYAAIIKNPMDIGTMIKKLKQLQYQSKKQFADDLELIWSNCLKYNAVPTHPLRRKAEHMRELTRNLTRLIPDIVVRDRADVEAEERRLHPDDDDAEESEDEPLMSTRGRKAPAKTSKKGVSTARKAPANGGDTTQEAPSDSKPHPVETLSVLANFKHEHLRADADLIGEGSQGGFVEPLPGDSTPIGNSVAPPSQTDISEIDGIESGANGATIGANEEPDDEDEEYQTWKQVTKKDRARVAAERHRLFTFHRVNQEEPALLRSKGGMRRLLRLQNGQQPVDLPSGEMPEVEGKPINQAATLAEGMDVDEDCVLPDYYEPLNNIPAIDECLLWAEDAEGQVIQHEEFLRALPTGLFDPPQSALTSKIDAHMRQMQDTRKVVAKIGVVKQMQLQAQTYQNQFQKYDPPPLRDHPIEATVVSDDELIMSQKFCRAALQRSVAKIFYHAGFEDFQPSAMEAITDLAGNYFADIASNLSVYHDAPMTLQPVSTTNRRKLVTGAAMKIELVPRFTNEETVLHILQAFSHDMNDLDYYVKEDLDRLTSRLETHHTRTRDYLADLLRPALDPASVGADGVGAFNDGSEQFVGGDFAEDLDEDFFGFRELGLDREFGLANLSVPLHLLQARVHNAYQPASSNATVGLGQVMPQPPAYHPITLEILNNQIGIVKDFFAKKFEANDDETLIEDDELPVKQRFPKPRLPPTGKISSPRKRPIREQQQMARKKRRLEIEAEKEREREREAEAAGLIKGTTEIAAKVAVASKPTIVADPGHEKAVMIIDAVIANGHPGHQSIDGGELRLDQVAEVEKSLTSVSVGKVKLDAPPVNDITIAGDPQKRRQGSSNDARELADDEDCAVHSGHDDSQDGTGDDDAQGDADGEEEEAQTAILSSESLPIAAH